MSRTLANAVSNQNDKEERYADLALQNGSPSRFPAEGLSARTFADSLDPKNQKGRNEALGRAQMWLRLAQNFTPVGSGADPALEQEVA